MTHESNCRSREAWQQHPLSSAPTLQTSMDSQGQTEALHSLPSIRFSEAPSFTEIKSIPANRIGGAGGEARRGLAGWYEKKRSHAADTALNRSEPHSEIVSKRPLRKIWQRNRPCFLQSKSVLSLPKLYVRLWLQCLQLLYSLTVST